jgi:hypothetical protein
MSGSSFSDVYLVRHGETAWSITGQHTGRTDLALTSRGEEEVRALGLPPADKGPLWGKHHGELTMASNRQSYPSSREGAARMRP